MPTSGYQGQAGNTSVAGGITGGGSTSSESANESGARAVVSVRVNTEAVFALT